MSLLKFFKAQLGLSSTPANNFTLDASAQDGTMKLSRGNAGATTQDVLVVDAAGIVRHPPNAIAFSVTKTNSQTSTVAGINGPILFNNILFDTKSSYNPATGRFTPTVAGYYQINFGVGIVNNPQRLFAYIFKNGVIATRGSDALVIAGYGNAYGTTGASLVYLNGTTDYVDIRAYTNAAGLDFNAPDQTQFSGFLAIPT